MRTRRTTIAAAPAARRAGAPRARPGRDTLAVRTPSPGAAPLPSAAMREVLRHV